MSALRVRHPGRQPADIPLGPARGRMAGTSFYLIGDVTLVPNRALKKGVDRRGPGLNSGVAKTTATEAGT